MKNIFFLILFFLFFSLNVYSQASSCSALASSASNQVCGSTPAFPAIINGGAGTFSGTAGCLGSTPNESWFYMNITTPGTMSGTITNSAARDIDGAIFGPYATIATGCVDLSDGSIPTPVACDYSGSATVPYNFVASVGYYLVVITNYSNANTNITLNVDASSVNNLCCVQITVTPTNICIGSSEVFTQTGAPAGGVWSVSGGGTVTNSSTGAFTSTSVGCYTATYKMPSGCSDSKSFVIFPTAPVITAPANTCTTAYTLPTVTAVTGFTVEYSIDGGAYSATPTIPATPGCHTTKAHYATTAACGNTPALTSGIGGCSDSNIVSTVIFPTTPVITAPANTCAAAYTLPTVTAVTGFTVEYSIDGGTYSASLTMPTTPGCHTTKAHYATTAACGNTPALTSGIGGCSDSNIVSTVIFPTAPASPTVNSGYGAITITPPTTVSGFNIQYSFDNGVTWGTNTPPTADNCSGYNIKTRYITNVTCGANPSGTLSSIAACKESTATTRIIDTTNPTIVCPTNPTANTGAATCTASVVTPNPTTADNCAVTKLTWVMTGATTGSSAVTGINNLGTQIFNTGTTTVTYTVADAAGNSATCSYTVTVTDTIVPTITCPTNQNISGCTTSAITGNTYSTTAVSLSPTLFVTAGGSSSDNCSVTNITYQDSAVGSCPIVVTRTWKAYDAAGNVSTCNQTINIQDTTKPVLSGQGANYTSCSSAYSFTAPTVTDNCDLSPTISFVDTTSSGTNPNANNYTRTWTAKDSCGNVSLAVSQTVLVQLMVTPVVTVVNNCGMGTTTLSTNALGSLLWSTGATTSSITVSTAGSYTVKSTLNGCVSALGTGVANPLIAPLIP